MKMESDTTATCLFGEGTLELQLQESGGEGWRGTHNDTHTPGAASFAPWNNLALQVHAVPVPDFLRGAGQFRCCT